MATQIRTTLPSILALMQTQLQNILQFPAERVVVQKPGGPLRLASLQADQYIVIRPRSQMTERPIVLGAGRVDARVERRVTVVAWSRLNIDYAGQDYSWLTDTTYGELYLEAAVFDALVTWLPIDSGGNVLAFPARLESVTEPITDVADWGWAGCDFVFQYPLALNQSRQW